jgi:hypothetical protein
MQVEMWPEGNLNQQLATSMVQFSLWSRGSVILRDTFFGATESSLRDNRLAADAPFWVRWMRNGAM